MNSRKAILILVIVLFCTVVGGCVSFAQSINDRLINDFKQGLEHANVYHEAFISDLGEPIEVTLIVYEEPVKIDYLYGSIEEVDLTTPEGIYLSLISCISIEWWDMTYDITTPAEWYQEFADSFFEVEIEKQEPFVDYIVARIELTYEDTDYVLLKRFRGFPENPIYSIGARPDVFVSESLPYRWKRSVKPTSGPLADLISAFLYLKTPIFTEMLSGEYQTPIFEVQHLYNESFRNGYLDLAILSEGLYAFFDGDINFNLADILTTYYTEEFMKNDILMLNETRKTWDEIQDEKSKASQLYYDELRLKVEAAREGQ